MSLRSYEGDRIFRNSLVGGSNQFMHQCWPTVGSRDVKKWQVGPPLCTTTTRLAHPLRFQRVGTSPFCPAKFVAFCATSQELSDTKAPFLCDHLLTAVKGKESRGE